MHACAHACVYVFVNIMCLMACRWRSENNVWEIVLSSTMWDLEIEFRLSGLEANLFTAKQSLKPEKKFSVKTPNVSYL